MFLVLLFCYFRASLISQADEDHPRSPGTPIPVRRQPVPLPHPGETEQDFKDTIELVEKIGFVNSYSFIFSPRPGTPATNRILNDLTESKKRLKKLQSILENFQLEKNKKYRGKYCEVLVENKLDMQEKYFGRTKYMSPVIFESDSCKPGELVNVKILSINRNNLFGIHRSNKEKIG